MLVYINGTCIRGGCRISKVEWRASDSASLQRTEHQENEQLDSQTDLAMELNNITHSNIPNVPTPTPRHYRLDGAII